MSATERGDEVIGALEALTDAIEHNSRDEQLLKDRIEGLRQAVEAGTDVTVALRQEPSPGTMQVLGRVLARLMESSGTLRRTLARTMRTEGTSIPAIARLFGVTHQRVSNILNRPAAGPAAVSHDRPEPGGASPTEMDASSTEEDHGEERVG